MKRENKVRGAGGKVIGDSFEDLEKILARTQGSGRGYIPLDLDKLAMVFRDLSNDPRLSKKEALLRHGFPGYLAGVIYKELRNAKESGKYKSWREYLSGPREFRPKVMKVREKRGL